MSLGYVSDKSDKGRLPTNKNRWSYILRLVLMAAMGLSALATIVFSLEKYGGGSPMTTAIIAITELGLNCLALLIPGTCPAIL